MGSTWCAKCRAWHAQGDHHPDWQCRYVGSEEVECEPVRAFDAEQAAERFVEEGDDGWALDQTAVDVDVLVDGEWVGFTVEVEAVVQYDARRRS